MANKIDFRINDIVKIRHVEGDESVNMVVVKVNESYSFSTRYILNVECIWFCKNRILQQQAFDPDYLIMVSPAPSRNKETE